MQDMFAVTAVCRDWRRTAFHQFFQQQWHAPADIIHPLQLLQLVSDVLCFKAERQHVTFTKHPVNPVPTTFKFKAKLGTERPKVRDGPLDVLRLRLVESEV